MGRDDLSRRRTGTTAQTREALIRRVAARLAEVPGVAAIALGGSWARAQADELSDLDFGLYYDPRRPPSIAKLRALARELQGRRRTGVVTALGGWGPWIDGGAWLTIAGFPVDWIYRDLSRVAGAIEDTRAGRIASHYQPGHPHAFHTAIYAGEVHHARILHDPSGRLEALQHRTRVYPAALARAVRRGFLWEARFALETAEKPARRGDVFAVSGSLFRCAACLVQVLFAANGRWCVNEKGALAATDSFSKRPARFAARVRRVLARPGTTPAELSASVARLAALAAEADEQSR